MTLFRLKEKCGNHIEKDKKGNLITYTSKPGSNLVESDRDLVAKYPSKFELVSEGGVVITPPDIPEPSKKKGKAKITAPESKYGVDVTSKFPTAAKVELKVFEKSKWFTVVDPDDNKVLNDKKLREGKVEDFLAEYLEPEEEEDKDENEDEDEDTDEDEEKDEDEDEDEDEGD